MTEGSFAAYVPQPVLDQITVRENKFGREGEVAYSPEDLEVIHGNTVWCLLRSGVDAPANPADRYVMPDGRKIETSNKYALAGMLGGDQLKQYQEGKEWGKRGGIETVDNADTAFYQIKEHQGHKPRPGITGFNVKNLDTWGMILEANINIKVWSREDLDLMDMLYFKPGYPALFEWGHSLYFDSDGKVCKNPKIMVSNETFFKGGKFSELENLIYEARQQDCNREAVFGYITNFSWSFNQDGSFDCTLKILSKGGVLESLRLSSNSDPNADSGAQEDIAWWMTSDYHRLLKVLENYYSGEKSVKAVDPPYSSAIGLFGGATAIGAYLHQTKETQKNKIREEANRLGEIKEVGSEESLLALTARRAISEIREGKGAILSLRKALEFNKDSATGLESSLWKDLVDCPVVVVPTSEKGKKRGVRSFYITLETLCHIINNFQKSTGEAKFVTNSDQRYGHADLEYRDQDKKAVYLPSLNPVVALKQSQVKSKDYAIRPDGAGFSECVGSYTACESDDRILNIWINFNVFVELIENKVKSNSEYRFEVVFRELLTEIQKAFGNVNYFDFHGLADFPGFFEIVDRSYVRPEGEKIPILNVSGLFNTVTNLKVTSDISQDIVNEMCIAATAPSPKTSGAENADECLIFWGENCRARWYTLPQEVSEKEAKTVADQQKSEEEAREQWLERLKKLYTSFQGGKVLDVKASQENVDCLLAAFAADYASFQVDGERYYKNQVRVDIQERTHLHMGIIPYKMTLTMLGISRLYIGNTFKIRNGILPKKYDNWGYIITGIEHSVQNNQWFTTLTTNYYPVFPNEKESKPVLRDTEGVRIDGSGGGQESITPSKDFKDGVITVSAARTSDNNSLVGDQRGVEVVTKQVKLSYYLRNGYSRIYRNSNASEAQQAAEIAKKLATDDRIGYSQPRRLTLYNQLVGIFKGDVDKYLKQSGSLVAADTDCSAFCHTCYAAVNPTLYTLYCGNLATTGTNMVGLVRNGSWTVISLSEIKSPSQLQVGDILWRNGHVEMVTGL